VNSVGRLFSWGKFRHSLTEMLTQNRQKLTRCRQKTTIAGRTLRGHEQRRRRQHRNRLKSPQIEEAALGKLAAARPLGRMRGPHSAYAAPHAIFGRPDRISLGGGTRCSCSVATCYLPDNRELMSCSTIPRFFDQYLEIKGVFATKRGRRPPIPPVFSLLAGRQPPGGAGRELGRPLCGGLAHRHGVRSLRPSESV
jgi:hypothetical protein